MKCKNCGKELNDNDIYCTSCGAKVDNLQIPSNNHKKEKKIIKLCGIIVLIVVVVVLIIAGIMFLTKPKDIEIEANDLADLIAEKQADKYYSDNLYVRGYLYRDPSKTANEEGYFILVSDLNDVNDSGLTDQMILFSYDKGLDEDLGTGSEITVQGNLRKDSDGNATQILIGEKIIVHKKVKFVKSFGSTTELIEQSENYLNKKVTVLGKLFITNSFGAYISDEKLVDSIWLYKISNSELFETQQRGDWCIVTGKLIIDGSNLAIEVDSVEQNDFTDELSLRFDNLDLEYIESHSEQLIGKEISVVGNLGMDFTEVESGRYAPALYNEDSSKFIELTGKNPDIGNCLALVYGRLEERNGRIVLDVDEYEVMKQYGIFEN